MVCYLYDAAGTKLRSTVFDGTTQLSRTDYVAGLHYTDQQADFIQHAEGRIRFDGNAFAREYVLRDHPRALGGRGPPSVAWRDLR